jgi:hypothetical protein
MTHDSLGMALRDPGIRTGGAQGTELLGQAVVAYRSALEVFAPKAFPTYHDQVQRRLDACELLLKQAKVKTQ